MGLNIFNIFLLGTSFIAFIISAGFITDASRRIGTIPDRKQNKDLESAYKYSIWASILGWISVAPLIAAVIVILIFSEEVYASGFADYLVTGLLFFTLAGSAILGICAAIVASDINKSKVSDNKGSYRQAIIATIISILAFLSVLVAFFIKLFYKPKPKATESDISNLESELEIERDGDPEPDMT
jgi:hypothetical protein